MEAQDREWLRANRHRIKIGVQESEGQVGHIRLELDDWDVYDATEDYLNEDCHETMFCTVLYNKYSGRRTEL